MRKDFHTEIPREDNFTSVVILQRERVLHDDLSKNGIRDRTQVDLYLIGTSTFNVRQQFNANTSRKNRCNV